MSSYGQIQHDMGIFTRDIEREMSSIMHSTKKRRDEVYTEHISQLTDVLNRVKAFHTKQKESNVLTENEMDKMSSSFTVIIRNIACDMHQ